MSSDLFDSLDDINIRIRFPHATCELGMKGLKAINVTCYGKNTNKKKQKNPNKKKLNLGDILLAIYLKKC